MARKMTIANDVFKKNAAFGANFNVIMTSQHNVKSKACYVLTSVYARGPVTNINKSSVLTARAHENRLTNTRLSLYRYMMVNIVWPGYLCNNI